MRTTALRRTTRLAIASGVLASACSLVNSFDDVKPSAEGTYQPGAPSGFDGGVATDGAAIDAATEPPKGAIVVAGQVERDGSLESVLAVLDPASGREIAPREAMVVAAIRYDGLRDAWYVFESKGQSFVPGPGDRVVLHTRTFDLATGTWTTVGSVDVPTLQSYDSIAVTRERLVYVAYENDAGAPALVTLSTSDLGNVTRVDTRPLDKVPRGLVGTRNRTGVGGTVTMIRTMAGNPDCPDGGTCPEAVRVRVAAGAPVIDAPLVIGPPQSAFAPPPVFASFPRIDREAIIFSRSANGEPSRAQLFEPVTQSFEGTAAEFSVNDSLLRRGAVDDCQHILFVVAGNTDLNVHAVPLPETGSGTPTKISTGHSGQSVYYEATSKTVLAPFGQGTNFDLSAFHLGGTTAEPTLTRRDADWSPPRDIRPILLGIRTPLPITCP